MIEAFWGTYQFKACKNIKQGIVLRYIDYNLDRLTNLLVIVTIVSTKPKLQHADFMNQVVCY